METRACVKCGNPIQSVAAEGRPKKYCSVACRRSAEHEIRRTNALLGKLEERASNARLGYGAPSDGQIARLEAEIARQENRLRGLLDDESGVMA